MSTQPVGPSRWTSAELPLCAVDARLRIGQPAVMSDGRTWLDELGYHLEFEVADAFTWVALRPRANPDFVIPRYGRGASEDDAIESAARRYRVEEIGTDNARKPGEPLP